jgi:hypothetical protein
LLEAAVQARADLGEQQVADVVAERVVDLEHATWWGTRL